MWAWTSPPMTDPWTLPSSMAPVKLQYLSRGCSAVVVMVCRCTRESEPMPPVMAAVSIPSFFTTSCSPSSSRSSRSNITRMARGLVFDTKYCMENLLSRWGVRALTLERAGGQAGHEVIHEEGIEQGHGDRANQRGGHQLAPEVGVSPDEFRRHGHRHGLVRGGGDEGQRVHELVPGEGEAEHAGEDDAGNRHG